MVGGCSSSQAPDPLDENPAASKPAVSPATTADKAVSNTQSSPPGTQSDPVVDGVLLSQHPKTGGSAYQEMKAGPFDANIQENVEESVETTFVDPARLPQIDPASQKISTDVQGHTILETTHRRSLTGKVIPGSLQLTPLTTETTMHLFGTIELTNQSLYPATDLQVVFFDGDSPTLLLNNKNLEGSNPTNASPIAPGETRKVTINTVCQLSQTKIAHNQRLGVEAQLAGPPGLSLADTEVRLVERNFAGQDVTPGNASNFNRGNRSFPGAAGFPR